MGLGRAGLGVGRLAKDEVQSRSLRRRNRRGNASGARWTSHALVTSSRCASTLPSAVRAPSLGSGAGSRTISARNASPAGSDSEPSTYFFRSLSRLSTARNASCGTSTPPTCFMRFFPFFCFSSSLRLREMSPP
jgi:hypothetical protein